MTDTVSTLTVHPDARPGEAIIIRPRVLPTTAQFAIEHQLAWRLRNARGFLPSHFMAGDENERASKILAAIEYARAVGIEPMIALQNLQIIDGKVGASALLIGALLRKAGYTITDNTNDERSVVTVTKNGASVQGEFSMVDAARANLATKTNWKTYPRDMMYARALTQAARRGAQDAVLGMAYTAEELGGDESELAGVPVLEGEVREVAPGEPVGNAETASVQAPPAPSAEVATEPTSPSAGPATGSAGSDSGSGSAPDGASASPPPQSAPVMPLSGPALGRRMGAGRSIGPAPRRSNVVTVEQGPTAPATAPEPAPPPAPQPDVVPSQSAPAALTDEPVLPPVPEPVDPGKQVFLNDMRGDLRVQTAKLFRVNALISNHMADLGVAGKDGKVPQRADVPPPTPNEASDKALTQRIDADYPGRRLENLGETELGALMERFESNLAAKRKVLSERGIQEE